MMYVHFVNVLSIVCRTVFSYDRDKVRHNAMKKMLASLGVECVKTFNEDFLKVSGLKNSR